MSSQTLFAVVVEYAWDENVRPTRASQLREGAAGFSAALEHLQQLQPQCQLVSKQEANALQPSLETVSDFSKLIEALQAKSSEATSPADVTPDQPSQPEAGDEATEAPKPTHEAESVGAALPSDEELLGFGIDRTAFLFLPELSESALQAAACCDSIVSIVRIRPRIVDAGTDEFGEGWPIPSTDDEGASSTPEPASASVVLQKLMQQGQASVPADAVTFFDIPGLAPKPPLTEEELEAKAKEESAAAKAKGKKKPAKGAPAAEEPAVPVEELAIRPAADLAANIWAVVKDELFDRTAFRRWLAGCSLFTLPDALPPAQLLKTVLDQASPSTSTSTNIGTNTGTSSARETATARTGQSESAATASDDSVQPPSAVDPEVAAIRTAFSTYAELSQQVPEEATSVPLIMHCMREAVIAASDTYWQSADEAEVGVSASSRPPASPSCAEAYAADVEWVDRLASTPCPSIQAPDPSTARFLRVATAHGVGVHEISVGGIPALAAERSVLRNILVPGGPERTAMPAAAELSVAERDARMTELLCFSSLPRSVIEDTMTLRHAERTVQRADMELVSWQNRRAGRSFEPWDLKHCRELQQQWQGVYEWPYQSRRPLEFSQTDYVDAYKWTMHDWFYRENLSQLQMKQAWLECVGQAAEVHTRYVADQEMLVLSLHHPTPRAREVICDEDNAASYANIVPMYSHWRKSNSIALLREQAQQALDAALAESDEETESEVEGGGLSTARDQGSARRPSEAQGAFGGVADTVSPTAGGALPVAVASANPSETSEHSNTGDAAAGLTLFSVDTKSLQALALRRRLFYPADQAVIRRDQFGESHGWITVQHDACTFGLRRRAMGALLPTATLEPAPAVPAGEEEKEASAPKDQQWQLSMVFDGNGEGGLNRGPAAETRVLIDCAGPAGPGARGADGVDRCLLRVVNTAASGLMVEHSSNGAICQWQTDSLPATPLTHSPDSLPQPADKHQQLVQLLLAECAQPSSLRSFHKRSPERSLMVRGGQWPSWCPEVGRMHSGSKGSVVRQLVRGIRHVLFADSTVAWFVPVEEHDRLAQEIFGSKASPRDAEEGEAAAEKGDTSSEGKGDSSEGGTTSAGGLEAMDDANRFVLSLVHRLRAMFQKRLDAASEVVAAATRDRVLKQELAAAEAKAKAAEAETGVNSAEEGESEAADAGTTADEGEGSEGTGEKPAMGPQEVADAAAAAAKTLFEEKQRALKLVDGMDGVWYVTYPDGSRQARLDLECSQPATPAVPSTSHVPEVVSAWFSLPSVKLHKTKDPETGAVVCVRPDVCPVPSPAASEWAKAMYKARMVAETIADGGEGHETGTPGSTDDEESKQQTHPDSAATSVSLGRGSQRKSVITRPTGKQAKRMARLLRQQTEMRVRQQIQHRLLLGGVWSGASLPLSNTVRPLGVSDDVPLYDLKGDAQTLGGDIGRTARVEYNDGTVLAVHSEGTFQVSTLRAAPPGVGERVVTACPGYATVETDVECEESSQRHAKGLRVASVKMGIRTRSITVLPDNSIVALDYDTRVTSTVRGRVRLHKPDGTLIVGWDGGQVEVRPPGAQTGPGALGGTAIDDIGMESDSDREDEEDGRQTPRSVRSSEDTQPGVYVCQLASGELTTTDPERNQFHLRPIGECSVELAGRMAEEVEDQEEEATRQAKAGGEETESALEAKSDAAAGANQEGDDEKPDVQDDKADADAAAAEGQAEAGDGSVSAAQSVDEQTEDSTVAARPKQRVMPPVTDPRPPRVFVLYGDGRAVELISPKRMLSYVQTCRALTDAEVAQETASLQATASAAMGQTVPLLQLGTTGKTGSERSLYTAPNRTLVFPPTEMADDGRLQGMAEVLGGPQVQFSFLTRYIARGGKPRDPFTDSQAIAARGTQEVMSPRAAGAAEPAVSLAAWSASGGGAPDVRSMDAYMAGARLFIGERVGVLNADGRIVVRSSQRGWILPPRSKSSVLDPLKERQRHLLARKELGSVLEDMGLLISMKKRRAAERRAALGATSSDAAESQAQAAGSVAGSETASSVGAANPQDIDSHGSTSQSTQSRLGHTGQPGASTSLKATTAPPAAATKKQVPTDAASVFGMDATPRTVCVVPSILHGISEPMDAPAVALAWRQVLAIPQLTPELRVAFETDEAKCFEWRDHVVAEFDRFTVVDPRSIALVELERRMARRVRRMRRTRKSRRGKRGLSGRSVAGGGFTDRSGVGESHRGGTAPRPTTGASSHHGGLESMNTSLDFDSVGGSQASVNLDNPWGGVQTDPLMQTVNSQQAAGLRTNLGTVIPVGKGAGGAAQGNTAAVIREISDSERAARRREIWARHAQKPPRVGGSSSRAGSAHDESLRSVARRTAEDTAYPPEIWPVDQPAPPGGAAELEASLKLSKQERIARMAELDASADGEQSVDDSPSVPVSGGGLRAIRELSRSPSQEALNATVSAPSRFGGLEVSHNVIRFGTVPAGDDDAHTFVRSFRLRNLATTSARFRVGNNQPVHAKRGNSLMLHHKSGAIAGGMTRMVDVEFKARTVGEFTQNVTLFGTSGSANIRVAATVVDPSEFRYVLKANTPSLTLITHNPCTHTAPYTRILHTIPDVTPLHLKPYSRFILAIWLLSCLCTHRPETMHKHVRNRAAEQQTPAELWGQEQSGSHQPVSSHLGGSSSAGGSSRGGGPLVSMLGGSSVDSDVDAEARAIMKEGGDMQ